MAGASLKSWTLALGLLAATTTLVFAGEPEEITYYPDTYDDLDVDAILHDHEERNRYYACFMDTGPCHNDIAVFFKSRLPEAVVTSCKYCTDKQLAMFQKVIKYYTEFEPVEWNDIVKKIIADARKMGLKFN